MPTMEKVCHVPLLVYRRASRLDAAFVGFPATRRHLGVVEGRLTRVFAHSYTRPHRPPTAGTNSHRRTAPNADAPAGLANRGIQRVRNRTWLTFALVVVIALASTWVALPTDVLNFGGVKDRFPVREGLDLQGGLQVVLQAKPVAGQRIDQGTLDGTRATLERRVNGLGVSEPLIQTRGSDQIIVELPGIEDPQDAVAVLQETALLEIIDPQGAYLPEGMLVNTSLGPATDPNAPAAATPGAEVSSSGVQVTPFATSTPLPASHSTAGVAPMPTTTTSPSTILPSTRVILAPVAACSKEATTEPQTRCTPLRSCSCRYQLPTSPPNRRESGV